MWTHLNFVIAIIIKLSAQFQLVEQISQIDCKDTSSNKNANWLLFTKWRSTVVVIPPNSNPFVGQDRLAYLAEQKSLTSQGNFWPMRDHVVCLKSRQICVHSHIFFSHHGCTICFIFDLGVTVKHLWMTLNAPSPQLGLGEAWGSRGKNSLFLLGPGASHKGA